MITKAQHRNAQRLVELADRFGRLYYNEHAQTPERTLNLSIPCARLVVAGVVTGVDPDTNDGLTDAAVEECVALCRRAVDYAVANATNTRTGYFRELIETAATYLDRPSELEHPGRQPRPLTQADLTRAARADARAAS